MSSLAELESRARAQAKAGDRGEEALRTNQSILELDAANFGALNRLGHCYAEAGNFPAARQAYQRVLALAPEGDTARSVATGGLRKLKDLEASSPPPAAGQYRTYDQAFAAGREAKDRADYPSAAAAYKRACQLRPSTYALNALAGVYREMGQLTLAEQTYRRALELGDNPASWTGLAGVFLAQGRPQEAVDILLPLLTREPDNLFACRALMGAYAALGLTDRVKQYERRAWAIEQRKGRRSTP